MAGGKGYTFSTETEEEMNDWINVFTAALKKGQSDHENNQNDDAIDKGIAISTFSTPGFEKMEGFMISVAISVLFSFSYIGRN